MSLPTTLSVRVYYEDTDASGVVYHATYLRWFERGRSEWLRAQGFGQQRLLEEHGIAFTLAEIDVRFRRPARLDDELQVRTAVLKQGRASLAFQQTLYSTQGVLLTEATARVACVDAVRFTPVALPDAVWRAIANPPLES